MRWRLGTALAGCALALAGCTGDLPPAGENFSGPAYTLRVLASSELTDLGPILDDARKATGVSVTLTPSTNLTAAQDIAAGKADGSFDAVWLASNRYLPMYPGGLSKLDSSSLVMSSPVVLGVRGPVADRLGWRDGAAVSWSDIAAAAASRRFGFGMSDPKGSNSGLSALVGVATAVAGDGGALQPDQVSRAAPRLREFFYAQTLKAASSQELADSYTRAAGREAQGGQVDGLVEYESVLLSLNASGKLREPLRLIYPSDGVATADYSLSALASATPQAKNAFARLTGYLRTDPVQRRIMQETHRRPISPQLWAQANFGNGGAFELPFPDKLQVINNLVDAYYGTLRRPARTVYVLDTSGSMAEQGRLDGLRSALTGLTRAQEPGVSFQTREQVTFLPFSATPGQPTTFDVPPEDPGPTLEKIRGYSANLTATGNTALYDALIRAYQTIAQQAAADPDRITTIVLLTDGENNTGSGYPAFEAYYRGLSQDVASAPVFPILYGEANATEMRGLAHITGGQTFDGRSLPLPQVFALIRGSQ